MDFKKARARQIALLGITKKGGVWLVPSQSRPGVKYKVTIGNKEGCNCPDHQKNGGQCKHIQAAGMEAARVLRTPYPVTELIDTVPEPAVKNKKTYAQNWTSYNLAQTQEKPLFMRLLAGFCRAIEGGQQSKVGRPSIPLGDLAYLACYKVFEGVSARRFAADAQMAYRSGFVSSEPHFNSIINAFRSEDTTQALLDLIDQTSRPLRDFERVFAADSSGFANSRFHKWIDIKSSKERQMHTWTKVHIMCGVTTHIVTAVVIKDKDATDTKQLPALVKMTAKNFDMLEVCADKAYGAIANYEVIAEHGAKPFIAFKSNHTGRGKNTDKKMTPGGELWQRMFHMFHFHADEFYQHYHQRSNVETVFSMIKAKFRDEVRSKSEVSMLNEALCKIVCHNICVLIQASFELGLDLDDLLAPKAKPRLQVIDGGLSQTPAY